MQLLLGASTSGWNHPPLSRLLIAAGIFLAGGQFNPDAPAFTAHQAMSWRLASVTAASLALPALYALGRSLGLGRAASTLAALLLALDGTYFVLGRTAMTNVFAVLFLVVFALGLSRYLDGRHEGWLVLAGSAAGCALATRWDAVAAWAVGITAVAWRLAAGRAAAAGPSPAGCLRSGLLAGLGLLVLPVAIYFLAYVPLVLSGSTWAQVLAMQPAMYGSHASVATDHPFASPWWSWPLMLGPVWLFFGYFKAGIVQAIWAIGNPLVWWPAVPALVLGALYGFRRRAAGPLLIASLGLGLWLFWAIQPRKVVFQHYMLESLPFACLALAGTLDVVARARPAFRYLPAAWALCACAWFLAFRPLLVAEPVPVSFYASRMWLGDRWEFSAQVGRFRSRHHLEDPEAWRAFMRANLLSR